MGKKTGYLPGMDGWRAIAIFGVSMTHDAPWVFFGHSTAKWKGHGGDGVYLFFALSGILITWRILEEETAKGRFDIRGFYIRRFLRIQPAALLYLGVVAALRLAGWVQEYWSSWFGALLLYQNFLYHALDSHHIEYSLFTGHFWTLAVEEHFYILLSLFLFFVRKHRVLSTTLGLTLLLTAQYLASVHGHFSTDVSQRRTYWVIQMLIWPTLCAMLVRLPRVREVCDVALKPGIAFVATLFVAGVAGHFAGSYSAQIITVIRLFPIWIVATMLHPQSWTTRILELAPIRYIGRLSYSLYLWHVLFFHLTASQVTFAPLHQLGVRPEKYLLSFLAAALSYHFVEKPFMRLGHRLATPATPGHVDLETNVQTA